MISLIIFHSTQFFCCGSFEREEEGDARKGHRAEVASHDLDMYHSHNQLNEIDFNFGPNRQRNGFQR